SEVIKKGSKLLVIARAGIGVDNIDLDAATGAGIAVVNAPTGNTVAAAEHTIALMLAMSRNIPEANQSMKEGQWKRSAFMGIEVRNKTLGVVGLGRVGSEVARRAQSFGMRLLAYDPASGATRTLRDDLYFANGVAVSPDGAFVLVNETARYRVRRYWLAGPRHGESEVIVDNLPGFPDGISSNGAGVYWLALASPRNPLLDTLAPHPFVRKMILRLPEAVQPAPERYAFVLGIDGDGRVVHNLQNPSGEPFAIITSVEQVGEVLYLGSLTEPALARIAVPR
ncbi:MAG: SMP-30/gluconolactonase/LRE family protein, partial [Bacteroidetes bacterium]|nr:SMP-30/gluconolactonase/LRE family protein [Bacteroidota bacterium]